MTLAAAAARAPAAEIDQYLPPAPELQQTICTSLQRTGYRSTGQTDGQTPDRYIDAYRIPIK